VYITSAPFSLQSALKGGSLTSSIGANNKGNSPSSTFPIFTTSFNFAAAKLQQSMNSFLEVFRSRSAGYHLWMFLLLVLLFAGLSSGFAFYMVERMYGLSAEEFMQFSNPETPLSHSQALKLFQVISALGTFVIPSIVFTQLLHPIPEEYLQLNKLPKILGWVLSIGLLCAFIPIVDIL
jgi:hypothetical protein